MAGEVYSMTLNSPSDLVLSKHFKKTKLIRISPDFMQDHLNNNDSIFFIEGKIISTRYFDNYYTELQIKDDLSGKVFPVVTFHLIESPIEQESKVLCIGTMHINWTPDMRCRTNHYDYALKADLFRIR